MVSCTAEPISAITDFDYRFNEIDTLDLGIEPDTSEIEIQVAPVPLDTSHVENQESFLDEAAQSTGEVSEHVVEVGEAVERVLPEAAQAKLDSMAAGAASNPVMFAENLSRALDDTSSSDFLFALEIEELAAGEAVLAALLGLTDSDENRATRTAQYFENAGPLDPTEPSAILDCRGDAEEQFRLKAAELDAARLELLAVAQRAHGRNVAKADSFRVNALTLLENEIAGRRMRAFSYYDELNAVIESLLEDGRISPELSGQLRQLALVVLLTRLKKLQLYRRDSVKAIERAAEDAIEEALQRFERTSRDIELAHEKALRQAEDILRGLLQRCHDQGSLSG